MTPRAGTFRLLCRLFCTYVPFILHTPKGKIGLVQICRRGSTVKRAAGSTEMRRGGRASARGGRIHQALVCVSEPCGDAPCCRQLLDASSGWSPLPGGGRSSSLPPVSAWRSWACMANSACSSALALLDRFLYETTKPVEKGSRHKLILNVGGIKIKF